MVDAANQLLDDDTHTYAYDLNGNLVSKTEKPTNAVTAYGYSAEDQLIQITKPDASVITYKYDAFGRRVQKDVAGVVIRYVYDGDDIRLEYSTSTSTSPLARYSYGDGVDEPLSAERGGARYFYHANHLGSIRHLTDATGAVVNSYDYDAFGKPTSAVASVPQPFGFTGREADPESGLMHYRARAYDPSTGRFLQEDPVWFGGGQLNFYAYVRNRPNRYRDPTGKVSEAGGVYLAGTATSGGSGAVSRAISCVFNAVSDALSKINRGLTVTDTTGASKKCAVQAEQDLLNVPKNIVLNFPPDLWDVLDSAVSESGLRDELYNRHPDVMLFHDLTNEIFDAGGVLDDFVDAAGQVFDGSYIDTLGGIGDAVGPQFDGGLLDPGRSVP